MLKSSEKRRSIYTVFPTQLIPDVINADSSNIRAQQQAQAISLSSTKQALTQTTTSSLSSSARLQQLDNLTNQKFQIIARLIPEEEDTFSSVKEGIRSEKCIFKLNKNEIQIIQPDEKKILQEIDAFQKRERIQNSPPLSNIQVRSTSPMNQQISNQNSTLQTNYASFKNEFNENKQLEDQQNLLINNITSQTPEKAKKDIIKPFQSPISKINYLENNPEDINQNSSNKKPNTFIFDNIYEESVSDEAFFNQIRTLYLNCIRNGKNLVLLNLNRSAIYQSSLLKQFINGMHQLKSMSGQFLNEKSQFFLHCYEIMQPNNEKVTIFEQQSINKQNAEDILKRINVKLQSIPRKVTQQCTVYNFQLFDDNKLINEIVIIDMLSILDKKPTQSTTNHNFQNYNSYCKDLINLLNFQRGPINPYDQFLSIFLQKYKLSDELIIVANFRVIQPHITSNYYLLRFTQLLFKNKQYLESMFIQFCQLQSEQIHKLLSRDLSFNTASTQGMSIKEEISILSQKNHMFKEQIKVLTADLINHQDQMQKLEHQNKQLLFDLTKFKTLSTEQENVIQANRKKLTEQSYKIEGLRKSFGMLDNFDKSMMVDSKNKSLNNILSNISNLHNTRKSFVSEPVLITKQTQTDFQFNDRQQQQQSMNDEDQQQICKNCLQKTQNFTTNEFSQNQIKYHQKNDINSYLEQFNSDFEQQNMPSSEQEKYSQITPNRYLQHLDDILCNFDSKKSMSYFSPRNLSLANLALIENEGYKQKIIIKDLELEKLNQRLNDVFFQLESQFKNLALSEKKRIENLQTIDKLINIFQSKLLNNNQILNEIIEFYENEITSMREIIEFGFTLFCQEINNLKDDIKEINNEKNAWGQIYVKKTDEIIRQMNFQKQQKDDRIKQYEKILEKFGQTYVNK